MVKFKDFKVTVQVNGRDLTEYEADNEDDTETNMVTKYIEAETGAEFSILCLCTRTDRLPGERNPSGVVYDIYIDGRRAFGRMTGESPWKDRFSYVEDFKSGKCYHRNFRFSDLKIVEDDMEATKLSSLVKEMRDIGTIEVRVIRYTGQPKKSKRERWTHVWALTEADGIPEKALKGEAKSQFIQFGEGREAQASDVVKPKYIDDYYNGYAKFRFKYRSRKGLEDLHIVEPPPSLEDREVDGLNRDELKELVQRLKQSGQHQAEIMRKLKKEPAIEQEGARIKRERDEEYDEIMNSAVAKRARRRSSTVGEAPVVDLTED